MATPVGQSVSLWITIVPHSSSFNLQQIHVLKQFATCSGGSRDTEEDVEALEGLGTLRRMWRMLKVRKKDEENADARSGDTPVSRSSASVYKASSPTSSSS